MSRYRNIHCLIWNDDKFPFASDGCQLVFFHLITTPFSSPFGLYKASLEALAAEKRWDVEGYREGYRECFQNGFAKYDERAQVIYIPHFLKYNPPPNPNVIKAWSKLFEEIPVSTLKNEFYQELKELAKGLGKGFAEAFRQSFAKGMPIQEQEQEQEQEQDLPPFPPMGGIVAVEDRTATSFNRQAQEQAKDVLAHLNAITGRNYQKPGEIPQRLAEGFTINDCILVIDWWKAVWSIERPNQTSLLNATTPFHADKFDGYRAMAAQWDEKERPPPQPQEPRRRSYVDDQRERNQEGKQQLKELARARANGHRPILGRDATTLPRAEFHRVDD